jgi:hypothetical protein
VILAVWFWNAKRAHSERVNEFDERLGSRRTQAAQAMLNHARNDHGREPVGNKPMPKALARGVSGLWTLWSWLSSWFLLLVKQYSRQEGRTPGVNIGESLVN